MSAAWSLPWVLGALPHDLHGMFVRNGANPRFAPKGRYHWFDGDGMVHGLRFENGRATYRNRWVETRGFNQRGEEVCYFRRKVMVPKKPA